MKKFFSLMSLCLLLNITLYAQTVSTWDGTAAEWTHGSGTQADPYLIENAQNLAWIAEMVNGGITTYANTCFKLTTDLNLNNLAWVPIGNSSTNLFCGKFDGDNHFIDNISITGSYTYKGLFGITGANFRCENLGVNTNISSAGKYGGGIVAYIYGNNTVIENCHNTGMVRGYNAGGIVGYASTYGNVIICSCHNTGNISSTADCSHGYGAIAGGIVGCASCDSVIIFSCYNEGAITSNASCSGGRNAYSGGIIGKNETSLGKVSYCSVSYCYNEGSISSQSSAGSGTSSSSSDAYSVSFAGGIAAIASTISHCYNKGDISSSSFVRYNNSYSSSAAYSGGIAASASTLTFNFNTGLISSTARSTNSVGTRTARSGGICGSGTTMSNNYNRGDVKAYATYGSSNTTDGTRNAGGIVGFTSGTIMNCYNTGTLVGGSKGGIRGSSTGTVTNCYYLSTCGGTVSGGTSKTEAVMKSSSFPILLNADSTVYVMDGNPNVNDGYPIFGDGTYPLTQNANPISFHTANLNGIYYGSVDVAGFEYKKSSDSKYTTVYTNVESPASYQLTGLPNGTEYTYRFFVQKNGLTIYGGDKTFTTLACDLQASISKSVTAICQGDTATVTATCSSTHSNAFTYSWSNNSTTNQIQVMDGNTYTVTVHDTNGCSATASASVTVNPVPQGNIGGNTTLCAGQSTTLTASGANSYHWSTGATAPVITVNSSGDYTCTFTNSYGCTTTQSVTVSVFSTPTITGNTSFCSDGYTTLTATGGDSYQWSTGATTASINVNTAGNYSVTASTSNGCSGSASVNVVQNQPVNVTITGNSVICNDIGTTLTATSGTGYQWSSGETTQSINVNNPGSYSVTVTNANGCSGSSSQTVTMMESAVITGNTNICEGETAILSVSGAGTYTWSNGAHTSTITVGTPGNYTVTASLPNGCSSTASAEVTVATAPTPTILGNTTLCQGQSTTLTANGGVSYSWSNGSTNNSISVSQSGLYTVTATNAEGCSAPADVTVTVNPLPNVNITGNNSFCQGDNVSLTATGASSYVWNNSSSYASITVNNAGTYTVTGTDANGCSSTATKIVTVNPTYIIPLTHSICQGESYNFYGQNITAAGTYTHTLQTVNGCDSVLTLVVTLEALPPTAITGNTTICEGETATLTANGGVSYSWSNGSTNNSISVSQSGIYTVTATNAEGCSATADVTVTVNPLPNVNISGNTTLCAGNSTTLTATGADSYTWSTGDNTASVSISAFGVYTVTGTTTAGCSGTANVTVLVSQLPVITITGETDICVGESTILTANGGETYLWSDGTTDNSITINTAGIYQVIGYNAAGCFSMADATVNVWQSATSEFSVECADSCYIWNDQAYCATGDYTQILQTVHGCDSLVTLHLTITVGVDDYNILDFKVYPNPATGVVNVEYTTYEVQSYGELHLFDVYGKLLRVIPIVSETTPIDVATLAPGTYFVRVTTDRGFMTKSFVKW